MRDRLHGVKGVFRRWGRRWLVFGTWLAFVIGVSGVLLLKMFVLQF
jgi:hypothetical protein